MAATVTLTCPECDKQIKAPAAVLGKKIRCKDCGATFAATAPEDEEDQGKSKTPAKKPVKGPGKPPPPKKGAPAKPAKAGKSGEDDDANPYGVTTDNLANRCPDCANEMESEDAVVCLHCGYNTMTRTKARTRKVQEQTGGDIFLWLLPGIACVIVILILLTFDIVYCVMIERWIDPDAWYSFLASLGTKIWLVVPSLFFVFFLGRFAVKRLIIDNKPPEVEEKM